MKRTIINKTIMRFSMITFLIISFNAFSQTPVESWGQLSVQGTDIVNENGEAVQLQGMSLFWSQWEPEFYEFNTVKWLRDDWCNNIVRAACGVQDNGSPYVSMEFQLNKARAVIDAAIELNIYVLVDWHAHYATYNKEEAKIFFRTLAQEYGDHPNVIYETFNEPIGYSWGDLKPFHEEVISEIRKYDPDNIIVCGTPEYSAYPDAVIGNAINQQNIAYTLHYYAGSHFQDYRNRANAARGNGLCVFVTEYGLVNADGNGNVNESSSNDWWNWMNDNKISHCNWSLCDKDEGSAALNPGTSEGGFWTTNQLTWSGSLVRNHFRASCPTYEPKEAKIATIPGKVEAEDFSDRQGIQLETTSDIGGGKNVGYIDAGDYVEYKVNTTGTGVFDVTYRIAANDDSEFKVVIDGIENHTISLNTGGWQIWDDITKSINLTAGEHTIRIEAITDGWNLNYINFSADELTDCHGDINGTATIDLCEVCSGGTTGILPNACLGCLSGISANGIKDDFTLETDPYNELGGLYSWGEQELEGDNNPNFQALISRNSENQTLDISLTQGEGEYVPFGFSFGEEPVKVIDVSEKPDFELTFTNPSETDINVSVAIQDIEGNLINTTSGATGEPFKDAWMYGINANVNAGATFVFKGTFEGGFNANYENESYENDFDFTQVTSILITVTNQTSTGAPTYAPLALSNVALQIEDIRVGDCSDTYYDNGRDCHGDMNGTASLDKCNVCSGGNTGIIQNDDCGLTSTGDVANLTILTLFPNPASSKVSISEKSNWKLIDVFGTELNSGNGTEIIISDLKPGFYFVQTKTQTLRFIKK